MQNGAAQRAENFERKGCSSVCGAASKVYGTSCVLPTEAKKGGSRKGASFSNSRNLLSNDFLKNLCREMRADRLFPP